MMCSKNGVVGKVDSQVLTAGVGQVNPNAEVFPNPQIKEQPDR